MKLFEHIKEEKDAAAIILELFVEASEIAGGTGSRAISPSSLNCPVACAFKLGGAPTTAWTESFRSRSFADAGTDRHLRIQEFLSKTEYWVDVAEYVKIKKLPLEIVTKEEFEVLLWSEEYKVRFRCDGILKIEDKYYVLEIKTERQQANTYRNAPEAKHNMQGTAYALLLDVPRIMWVYEGRDYLEQKPFVQNITQAEKQTMHKYLKDIAENVDTPTNLERNLKACGYCPYKNHCRQVFKKGGLKSGK